MSDNILVLFSGGADSVLLLNEALRLFEGVNTLQFEYPARLESERSRAAGIIEELALPNFTVDLSFEPTYLLMCSHAVLIADYLELNKIGVGIINDDKFLSGAPVYNSSDYFFRLIRKACNVEAKRKMEFWLPLKHFQKEDVTEQLAARGIVL